VTERAADRLALAFCLAALLLALGLGMMHRIGGFSLETDFYNWYAPQAVGLLRGEPYTFRHNPPGYILLLAGATWLVGESFLAAKLLSALATAALGWVCYRLVRALFDPAVALGATVLLLLSLVPYSFRAVPDLLGALATLVPIWLVLRREPIARRDAALAGVVAGCAYLLRANTVFLLPALGLALLVLPRGLPPRARVVLPALFVAGFLLATVPWFAWNTARYGSPTAGTPQLQVALHFYAPNGDMYGEQMGQYEGKFHSLLDVLTYRPARVVKMYLTDVLIDYPAALADEVLTFPAYLFLGAGLLVLLRRGGARRLAWLLVTALGYLLLGLVGFYPRYHLFVFPVLFLLVAYFLLSDEPGTAGAPGAALGRWRWAACVWVLAGAVYATAAAVEKGFEREPRYLLRFAQELRREARPGDAMVSGKPQLAWVARLRRVVPSQESPTAFLAHAGALGARYFTYSPAEAAIYPALDALRDPAAVAGRFTLRFRDAGSGTLVYEIRR
jgi:4-amino-4-deoxy-L-arabinose transferase-like glycosyltransferase